MSPPEDLVRADDRVAEWLQRGHRQGPRAVKILDLRDNLAQTATLTPSLKRRYEKALAFLQGEEE